MRIVLIGEYSGLHMYLKEGLIELGHDVTLAATGDGYKKIPGADIPSIRVGGSGLKGLWQRYIDPFKIASNLRGYDVAQFISPSQYNYRIRKYIYRYIMGGNRCNALVAAGIDLALVEAYENGAFDYYIFDSDDFYKERYGNSFESTVTKAFEKRLASNVDVIIPSLFEYSVGYVGQQNVSNVIPFPINTNKIRYEKNKVREKILFFHGLNREKNKGTKYIAEALQRLKETYPDDVEVVMAGHMPFERYLEVLRRANVIVDQCLSYGYGINACLAMAQGKIVISGCRQETIKAFGEDKCPIFLATPNIDQLYGQMELIVRNREQIPQWGERSRAYVERVHNYIDVAQKYVNAWKATGKVR